MELKEYVKHESETSQALDLISIALLSFTAMAFNLREVPNFGMFFRVMQTIHFIRVCVR